MDAVCAAVQRQDSTCAKSGSSDVLTRVNAGARFVTRCIEHADPSRRQSGRENERTGPAAKCHRPHYETTGSRVAVGEAMASQKYTSLPFGAFNILQWFYLQGYLDFRP